MKDAIIIDFEFTKLPIVKTPPPEMLETKIGVIKDGKLIHKDSWIHKTHERCSEGSFYICRITPEEQVFPYFSRNWLVDLLNKLKEEYDLPEINLWGFATNTDMEILKRAYDLSLVINCLQQHMRTTTKFEKILATDGASMGFCHYLVTGRLTDIPHKGTAEIDAIAEIYMGVMDLERKDYLTYVPWGKFRGQPLKDAIKDRPKWADGYRLNNSDILASSLNFIKES